MRRPDFPTGVASTSYRLFGEERIAEHREPARVLLAAGPLKGIDCLSDLDALQPDLFQHFFPGCTRQTTGNSSRPKIDVVYRRLRHRLTVRNIGELQPPARAQHPEDLRKHLFLVGAKIDH